MTDGRRDQARTRRFGIWPSALLGVCALICVMASCMPAAAEAPRVEAGRLEIRAERGYARLVFTFADRPRHQVTANGGVLILKFDRPIDVSTDGITQQLGAYVSSVRKDADGMALRFALTRKLRVNTAEAADQLYLDLLLEPWTGAPPPLPPEVMAEIARKAEELEKQRQEEIERQRRKASVGPVMVTPSEAPTFGRLEFLWKEKVSATLQRNGRELKIVFDKFGQVELGPIRAHLPPFIEDVQVADDDYRTTVSLTIDPIRDVRTFSEGNAFTIDVLGPERGRGLELHADGSLRESNMPEAVSGPTTMLRGEGDERPSEPPPTAALPQPPPRAQPQPTTQTAAAPSSPTARQPSSPGPMANATPPAPAASATPPAPAPRPGPAPTSDMRQEASYVGAVARMRFRFAAETPAAIFLRGPALWLVFETTMPLDAAPVQAALGRTFQNGRRDHVGAFEVLRFDLSAPALVTAQAEGNDWLVQVGDVAPEDLKAVDVKARHTADGRVVVGVELPNPSKAQRVPDPVIGDALTVVTARGPVAALIKTQRFVDFDLLQTAHGMALREHVDDLQLRLEPSGVTIDRDGGLSVTMNKVTRANPLSPTAPPEVRTGFIDFEGWKLGSVDRYVEIRDNLVRRLATAPEGQPRTAARLDLARFFLSHELGPEALAMMVHASREDPTVERDTSFRIVRGAAAVLAGRYDMAERDLSAKELEESADVALWRGITAAERGNWGDARRFLQRAQLILAQYPRTLQARTLMDLAEAQITLKDIGGTDVVLDEAEGLDNTPRGRSRVALLRGRYNEAIGRANMALDNYFQAMQTPAPEVAAEATLRHVALSARLNRVPHQDARKTLETLALGWRGDQVELEANRLLAEFAVERQDYRQAFTVARVNMEVSPASDISRALQDEMRDTFVELFTSDGPDKKPPLEMLALFYDFKDLIPSGRRGDEIIRRLADRLVDIDLLDQAIELLAYQVDKRLTGAARAEAGTELAFVHLLNREPEKALEALRRTRIALASSELDHRRNLIEARALASVGRSPLAVELLAGENSEEMRRLKADLLWEGKKYREAAAATEELLGDLWRKPLPLTDKARADVLRAAVGYALAADQTAIDRLRTRYAARMQAAPEAATFNLLTGPIESQGTEFRAIARSLAATSTMSSFLREYRERYRSTPATPLSMAPPRGPRPS